MRDSETHSAAARHGAFSLEIGREEGKYGSHATHEHRVARRPDVVGGARSILAFTHDQCQFGLDLRDCGLGSRGCAPVETDHDVTPALGTVQGKEEQPRRRIPRELA